APGLDGMPVLFYQKFWDSVGGTVTTVCLQCLNDGESMDMVNKTLVALIPKVPQVKCMTDFRPISLCNVSYKIIAKTLANRFRLALDDVIFKNQSTSCLVD
ncbi:hypothetical protein Ddye_005816, partial [Dipteronia dyeriana]